MLILEVGAEHDRDEMLRTLIDSQYVRNDTVLARGRFRVRGDVVEVQPANVETAYRISMFGDEVEQISHFDPLTGEVLVEARQPRHLAGDGVHHLEADGRARRSTRSATSSRRRWRRSRRRGGCSRRTASASAPSTTSRC